MLKVLSTPSPLDALPPVAAQGAAAAAANAFAAAAAGDRKTVKTYALFALGDCYQADRIRAGVKGGFHPNPFHGAR
jgi:hypothetical protein